jgi:hypothetical protein
MLTVNYISRRSWLIIVVVWILLSPFSIFSNNKQEEKINGSFTQSLQLLKEKLKNVEFYDDALNTIIEMYGKPKRYLGSGDPMPQWDINGAYLTCSESWGVTYSPKSKPNVFDDHTIYLIDTANRVDESLIGIYKLFTLPRESSQWRGDLELKEDGQYIFKTGIKGLSGNFFLDHSSGTYTIEYQPNINPSDLLENMKSETILAKINFLSKDNVKLYSLYFYIQGRAIISKLVDGQNLSYELIGYWKNFYYKPIGKRLPPSFTLFKEQIKNANNGRDAYTIIRKVYGEEQRAIRDIEVGSQYQWDVEGGILTYNSYIGVFYEKMGKTIYLIDTQNKVRETVIGYYSMYALASDETDKIIRFLGSGLNLGKNGQYKLETSGPYKYAKKDNLTDRFFYHYPSGTYTLEYQKGINPDDLLENMKDGTVLAKIDFTSGTSRDSYYICIKERRLVFKPVDGKPRTYTLIRYWNNYYQKNDDQ